MAITFVSYSGSVATSVPTNNQVGDLIIVSAFRTGTDELATLATGFNQIATITNVGNAVSTRTSQIAGWRIATATNQGSGTWTNASVVQSIVLRDAHPHAPIINSATNGGNNAATSIQYAAYTKNVIPATWYVAFGGRRSDGATVAITASFTDGNGNVMTNRGYTPATPYTTAHTGPALADFAGYTLSAGATSVKHTSIMVEVSPKLDKKRYTIIG